jgi:hypothetical protein
MKHAGKLSLLATLVGVLLFGATESLAQTICLATWDSGCIDNPCDISHAPSWEQICKDKCKGVKNTDQPPDYMCNNGMFCTAPKARLEAKFSCLKYCKDSGSCTQDSECCEPYVCNQIMGQCSTNPSPILINLKNNSANYRLTSAAEGVLFDINADGALDRVSWTEAGSDIAFLVFDRNGNGRIDDGKELFGTVTPLTDGSRARHGFDALRNLDGNGDGWIDASDPIFPLLRIWLDRDHNGMSEPGELSTLPANGITTVYTTYRDSPRTDENGNRYRYVGRALVRANNQDTPRQIFDVIFVLAR